MDCTIFQIVRYLSSCPFLGFCPHRASDGPTLLVSFSVVYFNKVSKHDLTDCAIKLRHVHLLVHPPSKPEAKSYNHIGNMHFSAYQSSLIISKLASQFSKTIECWLLLSSITVRLEVHHWWVHVSCFQAIVLLVHGPAWSWVSFMTIHFSKTMSTLSSCSSSFTPNHLPALIQH